MENIIALLPKAARWSLILAVFYVIGTVIDFALNFPPKAAKPGEGIGTFVGLIVTVIYIWFLFAYSRAARRAAESGDTDDVEVALKQLNRLIVFQGVIFLLAMIFIGLALLLGGVAG